MSSATPSRRTPSARDDGSTAATTTATTTATAAWTDRLAGGVRAAAFWTSTVLPVLVVAALVIGTAGQYPVALAGVLVLNVVCALVGHGHSPSG
ncbi:hypothetical protein [Natronomonas sp. LN261]|jgi:hypothetical protein|uniref:hypothetical protein n=1 Tax=Natronomonas sp. LN261 TaxID=2750669 RepID=UPI0015EEA4D9|nr:hypothetical protein [Natronomonas sp. LN261]